MPRLPNDDHFDADSLPQPLLGIATRFGQKHYAGWHSHQKSQLLFSLQGSMSLRFANEFCMLPPGRAAWIPSGLSHYVQQRGTIEYRSIYIATDFLPELPDHPLILSLNPLLLALIERIAIAPFELDWSQGAPSRLLQVLIDELLSAPQELMRLKLPDDPRLVTLTSYLKQPGCIPSLSQLATQAPASAKTITRIFQHQTGMSYQQWRQQWRLMRSIELMSEGAPLSSVVAELEFTSDSAFIAFFRQYLGTTPRRYMSATHIKDPSEHPSY